MPEKIVQHITNPMQAAVHEFLIKHLGAQTDGWPNHTSLPNKWLLIAEEFNELGEALGLSLQVEWVKVAEADTVATIDALADLLYVIFNMWEELQLDAQVFFDLVHENNMLKPVGKRSFEDKIVKPADHPKPDIAGLLAKVRKEQLDATKRR